MNLLDRAGIGRILPLALFSLDLRVGQGNLAVLHATNLVVHLLSFFAVYALISQLVQKTENELPTNYRDRGKLIGAIVAVLWALNPVQVTAVTYIVQRITSVMSLFFFLSVACYVAGRLEGKLNRKAMFYYFACGFSAICAFLSKQNSVMLPVVIALTELWFFDPNFHRRVFGFVKRYRVWCVIVLVGALAVLYVFLPSVMKGYAERDFTPLERVMTQFRVVVWYISTILWPAPGRLSLEHDFAISRSLLSPWTTIPSILLLVGLTVGSFRWRKRYPLITYGFVWFLANLLVESSIIPLENVFEHRMYLPSAGLLLTVCVGGLMVIGGAFKWRLSGEGNKMLVCVVAMMASALCFATFQRNTTWETGETLTGHDAELYPSSPRALGNHAVALARVEKYQESVDAATRALALGVRGYECNAVAMNAIVIGLGAMDRVDEAISRGEDFLKDFKVGWDASALPMIHMNLARLYEPRGELDKAYSHIIQTIELNEGPGRVTDLYPNIYGLLAKVVIAADEKSVDLDGSGPVRLEGEHPGTWIARHLTERGRYQFTEKLLEARVLTDPDDEVARKLLDDIRERSQSNAIQMAKGSFKQKYLYRPSSLFNVCMAASYLIFENEVPVLWGVGKWALDEALKIKPDSPDAVLLLAWCHYRQKEMTEAIASARRATELDPRFSKAWLGLGLFLREKGESSQAVAAFEKVLELYPDYPQKSLLEQLMSQGA